MVCSFHLTVSSRLRLLQSVDSNCSSAIWMLPVYSRNFRCSLCCFYGFQKRLRDRDRGYFIGEHSWSRWRSRCSAWYLKCPAQVWILLCSSRRWVSCMAWGHWWHGWSFYCAGTGSAYICRPPQDSYLCRPCTTDKMRFLVCQCPLLPWEDYHCTSTSRSRVSDPFLRSACTLTACRWLYLPCIANDLHSDLSSPFVW